jgi:hypothetical protein
MGVLIGRRWVLSEELDRSYPLCHARKHSSLPVIIGLVPHGRFEFNKVDIMPVSITCGCRNIRSKADIWVMVLLESSVGASRWSVNDVHVC